MKDLFIYLLFVRDASIKNMYFAMMKIGLSHKYQILICYRCLTVINIFVGLAA